MTTISGITSSSPQSYLPAPVSTPTPSANTVSTSANPVVISISSGTLSASVHPADATAEQRVNSLVDEIKGHNDRANTAAHFSWSNYATFVGKDKAIAAKSEFDKYDSLSAARITREFGESGISVQPVTDKQAVQDGIAPGSLILGSFSFKSGGSTYAMTAGKDGTLVGTRDGQAWKTWQILPKHPLSGDPKSIAGLSALQSLLPAYNFSFANGSAGFLQHDA